MKVNIYFVIWHQIEPHDLVCRSLNSHGTQILSTYFSFLKLQTEKKKKLNFIPNNKSDSKSIN